MMDRQYFDQKIAEVQQEQKTKPAYQQVTIFFLGLLLSLTPVAAIGYAMYWEMGIKLYAFVLLLVMFAGGFFLMMPVKSLQFFKAAGDLLDHILPYLPGWRKKVSIGNGEEVRDRRLSAEEYEGEDRREA